MGRGSNLLYDRPKATPRTEVRAQDLTDNQQQMLKAFLFLSLGDKNKTSWTAAEIYQASDFEVTSVDNAFRKGGSVLKSLEKQGLVKSLSFPGQGVLRWRLTEAGHKIWG